MNIKCSDAINLHLEVCNQSKSPGKKDMADNYCLGFILGQANSGHNLR